jgi:hypothetical protein
LPTKPANIGGDNITPAAKENDATARADTSRATQAVAGLPKRCGWKADKRHFAARLLLAGK